MKKIITFLCILLLTQTLLAQKIKIDYSPQYKSESIWFYSQYIGSFNNGPVILRGRYIESYSAELELLSSKELDLKKVKSLNLNKFQYDFMLNDKMYVFASGVKSKINSLYALTYTIESGEQSDFTKIDQFNAENTNWNAVLSDSKKSFYITSWVQLTKEQKKANKNTREHEMIIKEFDPSLNLIGDYKIELPYAGDEFVVHSNLINNSNVYFLVSVVDNQAKKRKKVSPSGFYLLKYEMQTGKLFEEELSLANASVISGVKLFAAADKIIIGGMCRKEMKGNNSGFVLSVHNSATLYKEMETKTEFGVDVYQSIYPKKKFSKDKDLSIDYMSFKTAQIKANGNIILMGEVNYTVTKQSGSFTTTYRHTNELIASEFLPNGEVAWQKGINKRQENNLQESSQLSCVPLIRNNQLNLIHFDYSINPDPGLICTTIDENGTIKDQLLFGPKQAEDLYIGGAELYPASDNELILILPKIKKYKILRIHLPTKS